MANNLFSSMSDALSNAGTPYVERALTVLDPAKARLSAAGLLSGGARKGYDPKVKTAVNFSGATEDWRVKISLAKGADYLYNNTNPGVLAPLRENGVIFPYTPQISVSHSARYEPSQLTHSNYTNYFYQGSEVSAITISGDFSVQNIDEGRYLLACIYFFRAATKMFFGGVSEASHVGNPPPMVFLTGYGTHYFPNVPCVVTQFQHNLPADVDYINIPIVVTKVSQEDGAKYSGFSDTRLPTNSQISVTLQPIYSRNSVANNFSLDAFSRGELINGKGGFI